ncbi:MAG: hypothetical protein COA84_13000 [Robiginitomaculum sp.]|nr:MAG: hypothetical protein COA84_13000 [Robiginitomaculum sp.]
MKNKVIITDADGVILDWQYSFTQWMARKGLQPHRTDLYNLALCYGIGSVDMMRYITEFNNSASVAFVPPFRDAMKYIKKLHEEHGYVFHCITSLSLDPYAGALRIQNIRNLFGTTAFEKIVCLDTGADKHEALEPYRDSGCIWVEDKPENAQLGTDMGLDSYLMAHDHNSDNIPADMAVVNNWKELYERIT